MFSVQLIFVLNSSSQFGCSSSAKKRKQLNSKVFERFSVKGVQRKVFHEVWRIGICRLNVLEDSQHFAFFQNVYALISSHKSHTFSSLDLVIIERLTQRRSKDVRFC